MSIQYIHELPEGKYRDATSDEIIVAKAIQSRREQLQKQLSEIEEELALIRKTCTHVVTYDEAGFPYDTRICVSCGYMSLL